MEVNDRKEQLVERLLRNEADGLLPPDFKAKVMAQIRHLPAPELLQPRRSWRDIAYSARLLTTGEKVALSLALLCTVLAFVPGFSGMLTAWGWELSDMAVSVTVGDEVLSASLVSVLTVTAGAVFMVAAGAYGARQGMVGA